MIRQVMLEKLSSLGYESKNFVLHSFRASGPPQQRTKSCQNGYLNVTGDDGQKENDGCIKDSLEK